MDIQQPVQQPNQQPIQPVPVVTKLPQSNWKIIISVVVGILVLGGVSYGAYYYWQNNKPVVAPIDEIADWETYRSDEYGFEFKYPKDWDIETSQDYPFSVMVFPRGFEKDKRGMALSINPVNVGRESVFDPGLNINIETATFGGRKAKIYLCPDRNQCPEQLFYSKAIMITELPKNWTYDNEIDFSLYKGYENLRDSYDKILSTFKFTAETANWQTYKNIEKGYSINYPTDASIDKNDLSCIRIDTKEFGSIYINVGSSNPCGEPTGIGIGMIRVQDNITIAGKQYSTSGFRNSDNSNSFLSLGLTVGDKIFATYGVDHFDKSNSKNWKNLGALTGSDYQKALDSAKQILSPFKFTK